MPQDLTPLPRDRPAGKRLIARLHAPTDAPMVVVRSTAAVALRVSRGPLGPDPTDREFGADVFQLNHVRAPDVVLIPGHGQDGYLRPGTLAHDNLLRIIGGLDPVRPSLADVEAQLARTPGGVGPTGDDGTDVHRAS